MNIQFSPRPGATADRAKLVKAGAIALAFFIVPAFSIAEPQLSYASVNGAVSAVRNLSTYDKLAAFTASVTDSVGLKVSRQVMVDLGKYGLATVGENMWLSAAVLGTATKALLTASPVKIAGTILAGYLLEKGIDYVGDQLVKKDVNPASPDWTSVSSPYTPTQLAIMQCSVGAPISLQGTAAVVASYTVVDTQTGHTLVANCIPGTLNKNVTVANMLLSKTPYTTSPLTSAALVAAVDSLVGDKTKWAGIFDSIKPHASVALPTSTPGSYDLPPSWTTAPQTLDTTTTHTPSGTSTVVRTHVGTVTPAQTGTTIGDNVLVLPVTDTITTTTDGAVTSTVTASSTTVAANVTPVPPVTCSTFSNCDWSKDSTLKDIRDGTGITQPTVVESKDAFTGPDKDALDAFNSNDGPTHNVRSFFDVIPSPSCVNYTATVMMTTWTVPICDYGAMMREAMAYLWYMGTVWVLAAIFLRESPSK